jgi:hypothetical protein
MNQGTFKTREEKPKLPEIIKGDIFQDVVTPRKGDSQSFKNLKEMLESHIGEYSWCVAFALKMCEDKEFYNFIKEALAERDKRGYRSSNLSLVLDPLDVLGRVKGESFSYCVESDYFPELRGKITYESLKRVAEASQNKNGIPNLESLVRKLVADAPQERTGWGYVIREGKETKIIPAKKDEILSEYESFIRGRITTSYQKLNTELSALDELLRDHRGQFRDWITFWTSTRDVSDKKATAFIENLLEVVREKGLYEGKFKMADIGTGSGEFSASIISDVLEKFRKSEIVRTNPIELPIDYHKELGVMIHDISGSPIGRKFDLIIIKDVMKSFTEEGRGRIWSNVAEDAVEGGMVISGGIADFSHMFKVHVKHNNKLQRVDPDAFLKELKEVKDHKDYLSRLSEIIASSPPLELYVGY